MIIFIIIVTIFFAFLCVKLVDTQIQLEVEKEAFERFRADISDARRIILDELDELLDGLNESYDDMAADELANAYQQYHQISYSCRHIVALVTALERVRCKSKMQK